jgi:hypothetical protein
MAPGSDEPTVGFFHNPDATNVEDIEYSESSDYVATGPALLDKFLHGRIPLPKGPVIVLLVIGWFGFLSWLFLQENAAGRIEDWAGLGQLGIKAGIYTVYALLVIVIVCVVLWIVQPKTASEGWKG